MIPLIKRHLHLYLGNPGTIFFSLLGSLISFLLYLLFLRETMLESWTQVPDAEQLLSPWLIGGTLTVAASNTTFHSLNQMIRDRETGVFADFEVTGLNKIGIQWTYFVSALIIGTLMQLLLFLFIVGYFLSVGEIQLQVAWFSSVFFISLFSSLIWATFNILLLTFVKRVDSVGSIGTILGTVAGFFAGVYLPVGVMPTFAQTVIKFTPFPYNAALYRQALTKDAFSTVFKSFPTSMQIHFQQEELPKDEIEVIICASQLTSDVLKLVQYLENWQQATNIIPITVDDKVVLLPVSEMISLEVLGNHLTIHTLKSVYQTKGVLKKILARLPEEFIQISKSTVINLTHLQSLEASFSGNMTAFLSNQLKVSVSRNYLPKLKESLGM